MVTSLQAKFRAKWDKFRIPLPVLQAITKEHVWKCQDCLKCWGVYYEDHKYVSSIASISDTFNQMTLEERHKTWQEYYWRHRRFFEDCSKRALSGYNYFIQDVTKGVVTHKQWESPAIRSSYNNLAKIHSMKTRNQLALMKSLSPYTYFQFRGFGTKQSQPVRKHLNAFLTFVKSKYSPELNYKDVLKSASLLWKTMTPEAKSLFQTRRDD